MNISHTTNRHTLPGRASGHAARCAIILAAGEGQRIAGQIPHAPKGFIRINDETLIARSIRLMRAEGIDTFVIVAGFESQYYEEFAADLVNEDSGVNIHIVHNREFASTTTLRSLHIGLQSLADIGTSVESVIIAESDLLYEQRAISVLQSVVTDNVLLVSGPTYAGDEVYVASRDGRLSGLSKTADSLDATIIGELVGLTRISKPALQWLERFSNEYGVNTGRTYEDSLTALSSELEVHCELIDDLVWTEIDDAKHLDRAIHTVGPQIARAEKLAHVGSSHLADNRDYPSVSTATLKD